MPYASPSRPSRYRRRGFTLLEALMASGILLITVVAVSSAVTAAQQQAWEARQRIAATLAAEDLLGRIVSDDYTNLLSWNGYSDPVGSLKDSKNQQYPEAFTTIGRDVTVATSLEKIVDLGVAVRGRKIRVRSRDAAGRTLADVTRFVAEPPA